MRIFVAGCVFCSFCCSLRAQSIPIVVDDSLKNNERKHHDTWYAFKTDALSILNSAIVRGTTDVSVSGEVCFNKTYSLQLNTGLEEVNGTGKSRSEFRLGAEFRWYLMKDDCPCSAMHAGAYFNFQNETVLVDRKKYNNSYLKYRESGFETGLAGGYETILNKHWVVDPTVYAGFSTVYRLRILESLTNTHTETPATLNVSVVLGIGYRF